MRILSLSNFYPPASRGGYEQWCQEVTEELRRRGHETAVLTSTHGREALSEPDPAWVHRDLHLEMEFASLRNSVEFFTGRKDKEKANLACLGRVMQEFAPDVVLVWGMWNLSRALPAMAEQLAPGRVVYYLGDYWPTLPRQTETYWQVPARSWVTAAPKALLKPLARHVLLNEPQASPEYAHVLYSSGFLRDELKRKGFCAKNEEVICGAIDTALYQDNHRKSEGRGRPVRSLLYAGRLAAEKGVHTAIEALSLLIHDKGQTHVTLTIAGNGEPDYEQRLRELAKREQVETAITFMRALPKTAMPALYGEADVLLFTSIWPEPFGRVVVEAMASGVAVVGTAVGGAGEILSDNENALVFAPGDANGLAARVDQLIEAPELHNRLAECGRRTAAEKFDMRRMAAEIEAALYKIVRQPA